MFFYRKRINAKLITLFFSLSVDKQTFLDVTFVFLSDLFCFFTCQLHKYHFNCQNLDWTEALWFCREVHTDLATVSSTANMDQLRKPAEKAKNAWIGLHSNNTWRWSLSGLQFHDSDTKREIGEPKDGKNCEAVWKNSKGDWKTISCANSTHFLCYNGNQKTCLFGDSNV
uniref:C-type lectin domain-containing protein n=1 Tax=Oryzias sinensis TaxID=183150 RepID=A0A8C7YB07_9TELE